MITLIKNGTVITMDEKRKEKFENLDVVIKDDLIYKIEENYTGSYDKLIDASHRIVMPGLINSHTHIGMSIFRATNDNLTLNEWLNDKIWPIEDNMTDEDIYYSSLVSFLEMIKTGTTCASDSYFGCDGTMKAAIETNFRVIIGRCLMNHDKNDKRIDEFVNLVNKYKDYHLAKLAVTPHSMYTCSKDYLKKNLDLSLKYDLPIHMHFCENKGEVAGIRENYGMSPIRALKDK